MEVRMIDAKTIKEAIQKKNEEKRLEKVNQTIQSLEQTAKKMLDNLWHSAKIEGIVSWEISRFHEPEVREWLETRGFKIREEFAINLFLVIPK